MQTTGILLCFFRVCCTLTSFIVYRDRQRFTSTLVIVQHVLFFILLNPLSMTCVCLKQKTRSESYHRAVLNGNDLIPAIINNPFLNINSYYTNNGNKSHFMLLYFALYSNNERVYLSEKIILGITVWKWKQCVSLINSFIYRFFIFYQNYSLQSELISLQLHLKCISFFIFHSIHSTRTRNCAIFYILESKAKLFIATLFCIRVKKFKRSEEGRRCAFAALKGWLTHCVCSQFCSSCWILWGFTWVAFI